MLQEDKQAKRARTDEKNVKTFKRKNPDMTTPRSQFASPVVADYERIHHERRQELEVRGQNPDAFDALP